MNASVMNCREKRREFVADDLKGSIVAQSRFAEHQRPLHNSRSAERLRHEAFCLLLRERRISRNHARSLPPGMNRERDQPLADANKPLTSAPPVRRTRRSAVTDAVGLAPSLLPRLGAVAITVTTTALAGEWCGVGRRVCPGVRVWSGA